MVVFQPSPYSSEISYRLLYVYVSVLLICLCLRRTHITNAEGPYRGRLRDHREDYDSYRYDSLNDNIVYMLPDKFTSYNQIIQYCL